MNPESFSIIGYLSVLLWLGVPAFWVLHAIKQPRGWMCHVAVAVVLASLMCATLNSKLHVNRIEVDRSDQLAEQQARMEAARKAAEDSRSEDVAKVRFAEDDSKDFLDRAGMDESELKFMDSTEEPTKPDESAEPDWKKEKKERSSTPQEDDSLEGMLDGTEAEKGMEDAEVTKEKAEPSAIMRDAEQQLANTLDTLNLKWIRILLLISVVVVILDYLKRANVYRDAYFPVPVPSSWLNGLTSVPVPIDRGETPRRTMEEELQWLSRRGDSFVYLTDDTAAAEDLGEQQHRLPRSLWGVDVLRVDDEDPLLDDRFVFEALWYGRSSFVVDSAARADQMLDHFVDFLLGRKETRAHASQTMHIVWDVSTPMPDDLRRELVTLAPSAGVTFMER